MGYVTSNLTTWVDEKADEFFSRTLLTSRTASLMKVLTGLKGKTKLPNFDVVTDGLIQDGISCTNVAAGDLTFDQRQIDPKQLKTFMDFCNQDLETFFTSQILSPGSTYDGLTEKESQFIDYIAGVIRNSIEIMIWQGEFGVGAGSLGLVDGLNAVIADEIVATTIPASRDLSGAQTTSNIIATFEAMIDALPINNFSEVDEEGGSMYVLLTDLVSKRTYEKDYRSTFTAAPYNQQFTKTFVDGTNIEIIGAPGLEGLKRSVLIKRDNMWLGTDLADEATSLTVANGAGTEMDKVFVASRFKLGVQIQFPEEIVVNGY